MSSRPTSIPTSGEAAPSGAARAAAGRELGKTGSSSSAISSRALRFELREKARRHADRTLVRYFDGEDDVHGGWKPAHDRYMACGHRAKVGYQSVGLALDRSAGRATYLNLQSCGSVWACPVCAPRILAGRTAELGAVAGWARENSHTLMLSTLTVRHKATQSLGEVWDGINDGWSHVTAGAGWSGESVEGYARRLELWHIRRETASMVERGEFPKRYAETVPGKPRRLAPELCYPRGGRAYVKGAPEGSEGDTAPKRRIGISERALSLGWARAVETTRGRHGWHVHLHVLFVVANRPELGEAARFESRRRAQEFGELVGERWHRGIRKAGFTASVEHGTDVKVAMAAEKKLAEYLAKDGLKETPDGEAKVRASVRKDGRSLTMETTLGQGKKARGENLTPFELLRQLDGDGSPKWEAKKRALWREWVDTSEGRRQLTWSQQLRDLVRFEEISDEELADAPDPCAVRVIDLSVKVWKLVRPHKLELLEALESGDVEGAAAWLTARGFAFTLCENVETQTEWWDGADDPGGLLTPQLLFDSPAA